MGRMWILALFVLVSSGCEGTMQTYFDGEPSGDSTEPFVNDTSPTASTPASAAGGTTVTTPTADSCPSAACGAELYTVYCATCHGEAGAGTVTWPGSIAGFANASPIVTAGRGTMAAISGLSPDDQDSVQLYLTSLAAPDPATWSPDDAYARRCAGCHGADGEGTPRGYQIRHPRDGYFDWITRNGISRLEFAEPMPGFGADTLSNAQLAGIFQKLRSYPAPTGGKEIYDVHCANCHGLDANGGAHRQGLLWVKNFPSSAFYGDVRNGHNLGEYGNIDFMPQYSAATITDADIDAMVSYIKTSL